MYHLYHDCHMSCISCISGLSYATGSDVTLATIGIDMTDSAEQLNVMEEESKAVYVALNIYSLEVSAITIVHYDSELLLLLLVINHTHCLEHIQLIVSVLAFGLVAEFKYVN